MRISHAYNSPLPKFSDSKSQRTSFYDRLRRGSSITIQKKQNKIYQITTSFHFAFTWRPLLRIDRTDLHLRYIGTHIRTDYSCTFGCRTRVQTSIGLFLPGLTINVRFNAISTNQNEMIYEDKALKVSTLPLRHRIPTCGFLFEEKEKRKTSNPRYDTILQYPYQRTCQNKTR